MDSYKEQHVSFVSNGIGTSALNIVACLSHAPPLIYLLQRWQNGKSAHLLRDSLVVSLPALLSLTFLANHQILSVSVTYISAVVHFLIFPKSEPVDTDENAETSKKSYLTLFKGLNVLLTCIAILAVDFPVFPRSFGKTETFGTSIMDIGVGMFIVSTAVTSKFVRTDPARERASQKNWSVQHLMVLLLGFGRFVLLKAVDYHEHVSEYGIHWNFFATLFCVWTSADVVHRCVQRQYIPWLALMVLVAYQTVLTTTGLTDYIFSDYREDIVSANKEGIFSLCGYVPLYLLMEALSQCVFFRTRLLNNFSPTKNSLKQLCDQSEMANKRKTTRSITTHAGADSDSSKGREEDSPESQRKTLEGAVLGATSGRIDQQLVKSSLLLATLSWMVWYVCTVLVQDTSRRLMNLPYVCMVLALTLTTILALYVADSLSNDGGIGVATLHYMSKHSLVVFLVANVLTGVVNLSMQTIHAPPGVAFAVLTVYTFTVTSTAWLVEYMSNWYSKLYSRQVKS